MVLPIYHARGMAELDLGLEFRMPVLHEIAHLGLLEVCMPRLDRSAEFFTDYLGLTENGSAATRCSCTPSMTTSRSRSS